MSAALSFEGVWIAIPAYNEEQTIRGLAEAALAICPRVIVVDDGSRDATAQRVQDLPITLLQHSANRGKAASLRTAFGHALAHDARCVVTIDGDGQHDPARHAGPPRAWHDAPHCIVIGSRLHDAAAIPACALPGESLRLLLDLVGRGPSRSPTRSRAFASIRRVMTIALDDGVRAQRVHLRERDPHRSRATRPSDALT